MIALTGSTGHLGQALLRQMKSRGDSVSVTVRESSNTRILEGFTNRVHIAPLDNTAALAAAFVGCDTVIHTAALIDIRRGHKKAMTSTNVEGTKNVLAACRTAGVRRLVYISSIEAMELGSSVRPIREDMGFSRDSAFMEYGDTKAEASRMVAAAGLEGGLETVLLCPTAVIGPWDFHGGLFTKMIRKILDKGIPAVISGGFDFVDVRDVASAALAALKKGRSGESYLISGEYRSIAYFLSRLGTLSGKNSRPLTLPSWLAALTGEVLEFWSRLTGMEVPLTRGSVKMLRADLRVDSTKAATELGYHARPLDETLKDIVEWLTRGSVSGADPV
jgi:dihydroflavonol-4-reductase